MFVFLVILTLAIGPVCGLVPPVQGPVVAPFAPNGPYAGHWGIDLAAPLGSPVAAAGGGAVTFAGEIAGRRSVTIDHGGGIRTSYSYLAVITVGRGDRVAPGAIVGLSGVHDGWGAVHFSLRIGDRYVDPGPRLVCPQAPSAALRLVSP